MEEGSELLITNGLVTKICPCSVTGKKVFAQVTKAQYDAWRGGKTINAAMPDLPKELREMFLTGITPEEWNELFKGEDE